MGRERLFFRADVFFDSDDILFIGILIADIIHGFPDQEDAQAADLALIRRKGGIRLFSGEWIEGNPAVDQSDCYVTIILICFDLDRGIPRCRCIGIVGYIGEEFIKRHCDLHMGFHWAAQFIEYFIKKIRNYPDIFDFCLNGQFFHDIFLLRAFGTAGKT